MRIILLFFCLFHFISHAQQKNDLSFTIDEYMNTVAMKDGFTGNLLVARHGKIILHKAYGSSNYKTGSPNRTEMVFNLGTSATFFTEIAVLMLQEKGKLTLADPICLYIKSCPVNWKSITIRHLLEQKSGIANYTFLKDYEKNISKPISQKKWFSQMGALPLEFSPGEKFSPSFSGYYILSLIIEKVSGSSLKTFFAKNIFEPLGMKQMVLANTKAPKNISMGYMVEGTGYRPAPYVHPTQMFGYGNLYGTTSDLFLWENALYGNKILTAASWKEIDNWTAAGSVGDNVKEFHGQELRRYFKGTFGYRTHLLRFPKDSSVIMLLTNNNIAKQDKFMRDIATMIYSTYSPSKIINEVAVEISILQRYIGNYRFAVDRTIAITIENGKLYMQGTGKPRRELVAVSDTQFYIKGSEVNLVFPATSGLATQLTLYEISTTITARRIE